MPEAVTASGIRTQAITMTETPDKNKKRPGRKPLPRDDSEKMRCRVCGKDKFITEDFYPANDRSLHGRMTICIECEKERRFRAEWKKKLETKGIDALREEVRFRNMRAQIVDEMIREYEKNGGSAG